MKIALLVPGFANGGGVPSVAKFLYRAIEAEAGWTASILSLATSANDAASRRLLAPSTWNWRRRTAVGVWDGMEYTHFGASWCEFEFQRYRPRHALTERLDTYDLVQVVSGIPAFAAVTAKTRTPCCLFIATTCAAERVSLLKASRGFRRAWTRMMTGINSAFERRVLRRMHHVFAESHYTSSLIAGVVNQNKLSVAVPGVDTDFFSPTSTPSADYLLCVARLSDPRKNIAMLLRAYALLAARRPDIPRLVLAGECGLARRDINLAQSVGIAHRLEVRVKVSRQELASLYRNAAVFLLSSDEEGLGMVLLEAMASGLAVVSTRCGGPETAVVDGKTGLLAPVGDWSAFAEKIEFLLSDASLRKDMGAAARTRAVECFSLKAAGRVYLDTYRAILARKQHTVCSVETLSEP